jgi:hypothetical protein
LEEMLVIPTNFKFLINAASYQLEMVPMNFEAAIDLPVGDKWTFTSTIAGCGSRSSFQFEQTQRRRTTR